MRLAVLIAVAVIALGVARLALEDLIQDRVHEELVRTGLVRTAAVGELDLDLPGRLGAVDLHLLDPEGGAVLASLAELDVLLTVGWDEGLSIHADEVRGRGGRAIIRTDTELVSDVPLVRALDDLIGAIQEQIPDSDDGGEAPIMRFLDIEAVVWAEGLPVQRFPGVDALITYDGPTETTMVYIDQVETGGLLTMTFRGSNLVTLELEDVLVGPALALMAGAGWGEGLAHIFAPTGRVDLMVDDVHTEQPLIRGELRDAEFAAPRIPFPLTVEALRFEVVDDILAIEDTRIGYPGGSAQVRVTGDLHSLDVTIEIVDGVFRRSYLSLIPGFDSLGGFRCADEGAFELTLRLLYGIPGGRVRSDEDTASTVPRITGGGGFHLPHAWLEDPRVDVHDLMGRFTINQGVLALDDVSASLAGGRVRAGGLLGLADEDFELEVRVEDVDLEAAHDAIHPTRSCGNDFTGWLQGEVRVKASYDDLFGMQADGQFGVLSGKFMETTLITSIFRRASMEGVETRDDQRLGAIFTVQGRRMYLDTIGIDLGSLGLTGTGVVDEHGHIDLELVLVRNLKGLLGDVLGFLQNNLLLQVEVQGTLGDPEVTTYPVAVITRSLTQAVEFFADALAAEDDG